MTRNGPVRIDVINEGVLVDKVPVLGELFLWTQLSFNVLPVYDSLQIVSSRTAPLARRGTHRQEMKRLSTPAQIPDPVTIIVRVNYH